MISLTEKNLVENLTKVPTSTWKKRLFVSISDGTARAQVWQKNGTDIPAMLAEFEQQLKPFLEKATYVRVDLVKEIEKKTRQEAVEEIQQVFRNNYFRRGVAFDNQFGLAFLAEEIQGNALLRPVKDHQPGLNGAEMTFNQHNIEGYLYRKTGKKQGFTLEDHAHLYFFDTQGYFYEDGKWITLETSGIQSGLRKVEKQDLPEVIPSVIEKALRYLRKEIGEDGRFNYGYYPTYDYALTGYNSVRHMSSLYAWLETDQLVPLGEDKERILKGLEYGLKELTLEKDGHLFLKDKAKEGYSLKLGGQAMVLIALAKYNEITNSTRFLPEMERFIQTIEDYYIDESGNTTHILDENLNIKKQFEIVYYDGEAVLGLLRAYAQTKKPEHLALAQKLFNQLIEKGYQKYHDHWLSYATNEILLYTNDERYYEFGLHNAFDNLDFIEFRDTAYPTMLELLMAAIKMCDKLREQELEDKLGLTKNQDLHIREVAYTRALHEINTGINYPELAMYMKAPHKIANGFMARHAKFRMRNDDQQHYLSGLVNFYNYFYR